MLNGSKLERPIFGNKKCSQNLGAAIEELYCIFCELIIASLPVNVKFISRIFQR